MKFLRWRQRKDAELDAEIRGHLDEAIRDRIERGESPEQARAHALREFGNVGLVKEVTREMWGWASLERLMQDLRFGVRMLRKQPGFSLIAILTLALGIGANTAIFSVVNAVLLRPLPYAQSDQLVALWGNYQKLELMRLPAKAGEYVDYRDQTKSFAEVAAATRTPYNLTGEGAPERLAGASVTANLFATLGAQVAQGRGFTSADQQPGSAPVIIVSHGFWGQRYGGAADFVGKTLRLNGQPYTVIGVMPESFQYPHDSLPYGAPAEVWTPLVFTPEQSTERGGGYFLTVIARLKPGVTLEQARAEMTVLGQGFVTAQKPGYRGPNGEDGGWRITVFPLLEEAVGQSRFALWMLLGAVALVLLIACANVANLLLARGTVRQREWAI
ncbi:MAG: ABC transporter permease, partial [Blastocatellia bacterium]